MALTPVSSSRDGLPAGLTGATAATRYVGATASGAPASGTFAVGDFVIDQTGKLYVCTAAGSPGTWTQVGAGGPGTETDYATRATDLTVTGTNQGTATTWITGNSVTYDGTKHYLTAYAPFQNASGAAELVIELFDGAGALGRIAQVDFTGTLAFTFAFTPSAAAHQYILKAWRTGTDRTISVATSWIGPCFMSVRKA